MTEHPKAPARQKHYNMNYESGLLTSNATDAGIMSRLAYQALENMGLNADEVLNRLGVIKQELDAPNLRTPHSTQKRFWKTVQELSGDSQIGLHLGEKVPALRGQVIEYLFLSSPSFGEGLSRSLNYQRLLSDVLKASLTAVDEETYRLELPTPEASVYHFIECLFVGVVRFYRYITDGEFSLLQVDFRHRCHGDITEYQRVFSCPVKFEQPQNALYISRKVMSIPSPHAEPALLKLHENAADLYMADLERQDFIHQINHHIGSLLVTRNATLETVAKRMSIKKQSLKAKLAEMDIGFNQLLTNYRMMLSKYLLAKTNEPLEKIIYLTGFSEPSTFYRAFKRWVGKTPVEYRNSKR